MKTYITKFLVFVSVLFFFLISLNVVYATNIYSDIEYKKVDLENFNSIVDVEVFDDYSYNLLVYERIYLKDKGVESYKFTDQYYILKYNSNNELHSKHLIYYDQPLYKISTIDDAKILITSKSDTILYSLNDDTFIKLDTDNLEYLKISDVTPLTEGEDYYKGYLVVGKANRYHKTPYRSIGTGVIIKYNSNFELEWISLINSTYLESLIYNSIQVSKNEYIVSGELLRCKEPLSVQCGAEKKGFVSKYDNDGRLIWNKEIDVIPHSSLKTTDENIVVAGEKDKHKGKFDYVAGVIKINHETGDIIWESEYYNDKVNTRGYAITEIIETNNNEFIATGQIESYKYFIYDLIYKNRNHLQENMKEYLKNGVYTRPSFILKFDNNGKPISEILLEKNIYYDINLLRDDKILLTGDTLPETIIHDEYYNRAELYGILSVIDTNEINNKIPLSVNYPLIIVTSVLLVGIVIFINNNKLRGR